MSFPFPCQFKKKKEKRKKEKGMSIKFNIKKPYSSNLIYL